MIEGLTESQTQALTTINVATSFLSFCGSLFIVACYLTFKELRKFSFKLVFFLSLCDMCWSLANMLGDPKIGALCYLQGYTTEFFSVASFLWTTTIAFTLHRTVVRHKADVEDWHTRFHAYVWGTSFLMTLIPMLASDYGPAGAWCWVQNSTPAGKILRFLTFYVPLWVAISFNGTVYFQVIRTLNYTVRMAADMSNRQVANEARVDMKTISKWGYYPLILIGSFFFGTVNKIQSLVAPSEPLFWLLCLHIGTAGLMGLFNSIAYGFNSSVRRTLKEKLLPFLPEKLRMSLGGQPSFQKLEEMLLAEESEMTSVVSDGKS